MFAVISVFAASLAQAQVTGPEIKIDQFHIDIVMEPQGALSLIKTKEGIAIASAVGSYFGIDPKITMGAINLLKDESRKGEETWVTFKFGDPANTTDKTHKYCGLAVQNLSINPPGKAHFELGVHDHSIGIYTVTPKRRIGEGRSWVEANIEVISARGDKWEGLVKEGKCNIAMDRTLAACKGPDCPSIKDGPMYK